MTAQLSLMTSKRKTVLLIGPAPASLWDQTGGIRSACQTLYDSPLSDYINWIILDTSVPIQTGRIKRATLAFLRIIRLLYTLITQSNIESLLIFGNYELTSFSEKGTMVLIGKLFRKRTVFSLRTQIRKHSYDFWFTKFRKLVFRYSDVIICQSKVAARELVAFTGCDSQKITVIMNWIDTRRYGQFTSDLLDSEPLRTKPITFIFVGHLTNNKAPDILLHAVHLLEVHGQKYNLVICGHGPLYQQLEQQVHEFGLADRVDLRGWVMGDELLLAFREADIFVLPTHSEGMPNALLEAMAAGLPVIATKVSSIPEIVSDPENGLLVKPGDVSGLAAAMQKLAESPELRRDMRRANRCRIETNHSIQHIWPKILAIL